LYAKPELFQISAEAGRKESPGWLRVTFEADREEEMELGTTNGIELTGGEAQGEEPRLHKLSLILRLEEIPRIVSVLNEFYLANHEEAVQTLQFDATEEWGERRERAGSFSITHPLFSRLEPETKREDWKDRIAVLQAYKFIGERLRDDAKKLGLLQPIDNPL
jgi:hypothetical protein